MSTTAPMQTMNSAKDAIGREIEYRTWRGTLVPGVNPFGASGREYRLLKDRWGIEYWRDPVTDIEFCSPRFSQESRERCYQRPGAHINVHDFDGFDRKQWEAAADRSFIVSRLKADLVRRFLKPGGRVLDVGCHVG